MILGVLALCIGATALKTPTPAHAETCHSYNFVGDELETTWTNPSDWAPYGVPGSESHCDSVTIKGPPTKSGPGYVEVYGAPAGTQLQNLTVENAELSSCPTYHEQTTDCGGAGLTVHGNFALIAGEPVALAQLNIPIVVDGESLLETNADQNRAIRLLSGTTLTFKGPSRLDGEGEVSSADEDGAHVFTNDSTMTIDPGVVVASGCCRTINTLVNSGSIVIPASSGGTAAISGTELDNKGAVTVGAGSTLAIDAPQQLYPATTFGGAGRVRIEGAGEGNGTRLASGVTIGKGTTLELIEGDGALEGTGSFVGEGAFRWEGRGQLYGSLTVGKSIATTIDGPPSEPTLLRDGTLTLEGQTTISGAEGMTLQSGQIVNRGSLRLEPGTNVVGGLIEQAAGSTVLDDATVGGEGLSVSGGTLSGYGTIEGDLTNTGGTVHPSTTGGVLMVTGAYTQGTGGELEVGIEGDTPGSGFGQVDVGGEATLAGDLDVETGSFNPKGGRCFPILPYSSSSGAFGSLSGSAGYAPFYQPAGAYVAFGLCVATSGLPEGKRGQAYHTQLVALDGKTPYAWKKVGSLPKGLKLSKGGALSGTPSTKLSPGSYPIHVLVSDATKKTATVTLTLKLT